MAKAPKTPSSTSQKANKKASKKTKPARGLGRGLSALMDDVGMDAIVETAAPPATTPTTAPQKSAPKERAKSPSNIPASPAEKSINFVKMDQLTRNPEQPRRYFDTALLEELAQSIRDKGVLQPILVRPIPDSARQTMKSGQNPAYQIIAGERRWQAALKAGLETIPVFIRTITDREALEIGVVENVHRADLNPMEEALAYKSLLTQFERTQQDVADAVGKSRPYIANMLRLLNLPETVQAYLAEGKISTGHARAIIAAPDPAALADAIVDKDLSVRDAEKWVRRIKQDQSNSDLAGGLDQAIKDQKDADIRHVEKQITDTLGLIVDLRDKGGKGELRIKYKNGEQLEGLIQRLIRG